MEEHKIHLKLDSPYRVKVESLEEFETSLFFETYKKAVKIIKEICQTRQDICQNMRMYKTQDITNLVEENTYTVVPFLGNRGTGKTSVMVSFAVSFLQNYHNTKESFKDSDYEIYKKLNVGDLKARFHVLDMIDATILEAPEEIIQIVLVRMLDQLREAEERLAGIGRRYREDFEKNKRYFMQDFEETIDAVHNLFHKKEASDKIDYIPMDYLKGMRISWNLKKQIRKLIIDYTKILSQLDFIEEQNNYLVIMIDDIDMNVKNCYEFLEIVRCYLMVPNVIVLLSTNYEQLHQMCQNYYRRILYYGKEYLTLGEYETRRINGLTNEYLEKMIPTGRKLFLPAMRSEEETKSIRIINENGNELTICEEILGNIYQYTGLLYCPNGEERHFMEPKTIRKLTNYKRELSLLLPIKGKKEQDGLGPEEKLALETNIDWMYHDVVNRLAILKLDGVYLSIFREIAEQGSVNRNSIVIQRLLEYLDPTREDKKFISYLEKKTKVSYGDVLYVLEECKNWQIEEKRLVECVIALYMVFIYRQFVLTDFGRIYYPEDKRGTQSIFALLSGNTDMGFLSYYLFPNIVFQSSKYMEPEDLGKGKLIAFLARQENYNIKNVWDSIIGQKEKNSNNNLCILEIVSMFSLFQAGETGENVSIDLLNFIPYIFEYREYMPKVLGYFLEKTGIEKLFIQENSLMNKMEQWEETFKTTAIIPFYSMDFMFQLAKAIHERLQKYTGRTVSEYEIRSIFMEIFWVIGEELKKLDRFYAEYERKAGMGQERKLEDKQKSSKYFDIFKKNPFIEELGVFAESLSKEQENLWEAIIFMFANQEPAKIMRTTSEESMQD